MIRVKLLPYPNWTRIIKGKTWVLQMQTIQPILKPIALTLQDTKAELETYIISGTNAHQKRDKVARKAIEREIQAIEPLMANRISQDSQFIFLDFWIVERLDWF